MEDFIKVSTSIHTIALKIVTFKKELVTLPDDYKQQVDSIDSKLARYREHGRLHGLNADSRLMEILKSVENSLRTAEGRLETLSRSADSNAWYLLFPENVEKIVKQANEDIDGFFQVLKDEAESSTQMQLAGSGKPIPTLSHDIDNSYVSIEKVQFAVIKAIEDPKGCQIVLLYGGIGKGKSTLARYMVHLYGNTENQEKGKLFEHVIWLSCSNCSENDISIKQLDILQQYSSNSLGDSPPKNTSGPVRIAQALKDFPSAKRVLIILDDVSNPSFLREMWKVTSGVQAIRYFVTSQQQNICYKAGLKEDSLPIFMEDVTQDEAMGILASHVGLKVIPSQLQGIAKKIIRATDKNPLALACLASHFANNKDNTKESAWQDAYRELHKLLNTEEKIVLDSSPRKLSATMKMCINTLHTIDAKKILFMMYECKAESVPEVVLRIWYSRISKCSFLQSRDELQMRELLKPAMNLKDKGQNDGESKAWSLGSLVKHYVEEYMVEEIGPVIGELVGDEELGPESSTSDHKQGFESQTAKAEKARLALILCALYFDQSHLYTHEAVSKALTRAKITYSQESFNYLRREAIEPIIWLLDKPTEEHWKEADVCCVRKVFLTYICKSELDGENVSQLVKLEACAVAQLATLEAIRQICYIEEKPLFNADNLNFVQAIVPLMDSTRGLPTSVQESASRTLAAVCWKVADQTLNSKSPKDQLGTLIIDLPGVLAGLVSAFASPNQSDGVVKHVVNVFTYLSYCEEIEGSITNSISERILDEKRVLEGLAKCLYEHKKPDLQRAATSALQNLAKTDSTRMKICDQEKVLDGLVKLLSEHDTSILEAATAAIANLAATSDDTLKLRVANQGGALEGLVTLLSAQDKPAVQEAAARALANLANTGDDTLKLQVANQGGALEGLVTLLSAQDRPDVQEAAARALANLANTGDDTLKLRVANQGGALEGLVTLLSAQDRPDVQEVAARALANLANTGDDTLKLRVANQGGALEGLVTMMSAEDKPDVQEAAARALGNITDTGDNALKLQIAKEEGVLVSLLHCRVAHGKPGLQKLATKALRNLTSNKDGADGLSRGLLRLLENGVLPSVQGVAAAALTHLKPMLGKGATLNSREAYLGRAVAFMEMEMYVEALADLDHILIGAVLIGPDSDELWLTHIIRIAVKARLKDFEGALKDVNEAVKVSNSDLSRKPWTLLERGVLKRIMGDLEGALADLDEGLKLETDNYERLKHRGYVKFLLKDEEGARADAEWALRIKPPTVDSDDHPNKFILGSDSVEYLGYKLK